MRIKLMLLALILLASAPGSAGYYDDLLIGLYSDLDHSVMEENGQAMIDVYLWIKPDPRLSASSIELLITYPAPLALYHRIYCADMSLTKDDITSVTTGGSICWRDCPTDWKWVCKMTFFDPGYYYGTPTVGYIKIEEHPYSHRISYFPCYAGRPLGPNSIVAYPLRIAIPINWFGLNQNGIIGTKESSWGAIKNVR